MNFTSTPKINKSKINKILFLMLGGIGDILVATPTIQRIREEFPDAALTAIIRQEYRDLFTGIDEVIFYQKGFRFFKWLLYKRFSIFIDLHTPTFNTYCSNRRIFLRNELLSLFVRASYKIGFSCYGYGLFLTHPIATKDTDISGMNMVDLTAKVLLPMGISRLHDRKKKISISAEKALSLKKKLESRKITMDDPIVIHPSSRQSVKDWLLQNYVQLAGELKKITDKEVLLIGADEDKDFCREISEMTKAVNLCGELDIGETVVLINSCALLICVDSGPMHIADALGKKCIALFSAHNKKNIWAPISDAVVVLRKNVPCGPCFKKECNDNLCMKLISVEEVVSKVKDKLA